MYGTEYKVSERLIQKPETSQVPELIFCGLVPSSPHFKQYNLTWL